MLYSDPFEGHCNCSKHSIEFRPEYPARLGRSEFALKSLLNS